MTGAVGVYGTLVPEEPIVAAGMRPVHLVREASRGECGGLLPRFACSPIRDLLSRGLDGSLAWLDAVAFGTGCDAAQAVADIWAGAGAAPRALFPRFPSALESPAAPAFLAEELRLFCRALGVGGDGALRRAVAACNAIRRRVAALALAAAEGRLRPSDLHEGLTAALTLPAGEGGRVLEGILAAAPAAVPAARAPRLYLTGPHLPDAGLYGAIEAAGGVVVGDALDLGLAHFEGEVEETGDPLQAIARRLLGLLPATTAHGGVPRAARILSRVRAARADGVLQAGQAFCDPHGFDAAELRDAFGREGIPFLAVEGAMDARTGVRVEAFLEMLSP